MAFRITQGDTSPALLSTLEDDESAVDLTGYNEVRFIMQNKYEEVIIDEDTSGDVNVVDAATGEVEYIFSSGETDTAGTYLAEFEVEFSTGAIETFPTGDKIVIEIEEQIA